MKVLFLSKGTTENEVLFLRKGITKNSSVVPSESNNRKLKCCSFGKEQ